MIHMCIILVATAINVVSCVRMEKKYVDARKASEAAEEALNSLAVMQHLRINELEKMNSLLMKFVESQREET